MKITIYTGVDYKGKKKHYKNVYDSSLSSVKNKLANHLLHLDNGFEIIKIETHLNAREPFISMRVKWVASYAWHGLKDDEL